MGRGLAGDSSLGRIEGLTRINTRELEQIKKYGNLLYNLIDKNSNKTIDILLYIAHNISYKLEENNIIYNDFLSNIGKIIEKAMNNTINSNIPNINIPNINIPKINNSSIITSNINNYGIDTSNIIKYPLNIWPIIIINCCILFVLIFMFLVQIYDRYDRHDRHTKKYQTIICNQDNII